jgi:type I restriction enzyme S subunit
MKVGPDYKQTNLGVLPDEWESKRLGELGSIVRGGSPRPAGDTRYFGGDFIPLLTVAALTNIPDHQLLVTETQSGLTEAGSKRSRTLVDGTVIIANSGATLGVAKVLGITCCANDGIAAIMDQQLGDRAFVCHFINTRTQHLREVIATGNGQPNLNTALIREIPIPFPPMSEQRAIAKALCDVDALLAGLARLIAKKRDLKQAAMQQLLTGQTRLPGFQGEWESTTFGQIAQPRRDRVDPRSSGIQDFCVELEHIAPASGELLGHTSAGEQSSIKSVFSNGDVLFGKLRAYLRKYWLAKRPGVCSTEIWVLAPRSQLMTTEFLFQLVKTADFIEAASNSYGTHMPRSDWSIVKNVKLALPSVPEQEAVATVLTGMDAELTALEARRDKTQSLKQAMMQELLTGRTRLV